MKAVDYSLYLVTDSTKPILKDGDLVAIVKAAIEGGVTIVQYRDKTSETKHLIETAKQLHEVTKANNVPLLINDRVDVALAVGCEGVHIGQDDIDLAAARRLLGVNAIIGVTASSIEEATEAARGGADYLGIGTVYATLTKENSKSIIGPSGVQSILSALSDLPNSPSTVCIGGINASNISRVLYQSKSPKKGLDGIAVVSAIISSPDPKATAQELRALVSAPPPFAKNDLPEKPKITKELIEQKVPALVQKLAETTPLCHNMTNIVVQNIAANVALAIGGSPIMAGNGAEAADLAQLGGSLLINMGSLQADALNNYTTALKAYNAVGGPVVLDPVGAGATAIRRSAVKTLMSAGYFDLIKGNENEIKTVAGVAGTQQRGVDSGTSTSTLEEKARLVRDVAARERNVVLMTGATDIISDGARTYAVKNGHELLGSFTGSGCTLGTTIAAFLAVEKEDKLLAALAAMLMFEIAAEVAMKGTDVNGPGTFVPRWLDQLYAIRKGNVARWITWAQVEEISLS